MPRRPWDEASAVARNAQAAASLRKQCTVLGQDRAGVAFLWTLTADDCVVSKPHLPRSPLRFHLAYARAVVAICPSLEDYEAKAVEAATSLSTTDSTLIEREVTEQKQEIVHVVGVA